jgi:1-deoxy-D-xylulose-5-phosphate reductoisomerase
MKKKIGILGSTGSIGTTLLNVINKKNTEVYFLMANKNYKKILKQAKLYSVKYVIITDKTNFKKAKKFNNNKKIIIINNYNFHEIIDTKLDYVMSAITGIAGLKPTFQIIKFTKNIAIANKESIICAWPLIKKELKKRNTKFIPVDSEHFSIWSEINKIGLNKIDKIYLTASGGPLLNYNSKNKKNINISSILKHPTWKMGGKISVDSATMMNKCYEIIEAKNLFNLEYKQIKILIHPYSYIHAIILYNNGLSKIVLHDTTMKIPIFNSIYGTSTAYKYDNKIDINKLNNLKLQQVKTKKYPIIKCLKYLQNKHTLYETVIVTINDFFVDKYLKKKINFFDISKFVLKFINNNKFKIYKKFEAKSVDDILILNEFIKKELNKIYLSWLT